MRKRCSTVCLIPEWRTLIYILCYTYSGSVCSFHITGAYGHGVYFAREASRAAQDSPRDDRKHKHVYLARVLVGEYTVGRKAMIASPPKDPKKPDDLYDSVVDNERDPSIFCMFCDSQAYPEYHIEFC